MQGLERLNLETTQPAEVDKRQLAESTASHFEEIFVRQMVRTMRSSIGTGDEGGFFGKGAGSGTYEDWFDSHLSEHLTESGGVGLAEIMLRDWERQGWIEKKGESDVDSQSG